MKRIEESRKLIEVLGFLKILRTMNIGKAGGKVG